MNRYSHIRNLCRLVPILAGVLVILGSASQTTAQNIHLGDLDDDGVIQVTDLALLMEHIKGTGALDEHHTVLADVTKDGAVNQADADEMVKEILQTRTPEQLLLSTVRFSSPASSEGDVAVTRETIVHVTVPLSLTATLDTSKFYAEFAGRKVLSRVEIASDRRKASLFYIEPLWANFLFSDDAIRGGKLGPALVPPDRQPSPLQPNLRLPFVFRFSFKSNVPVS